MRRPRTLSDTRALRGTPASALPRGAPSILLQMHRLSVEKYRLEGEVEIWARKKQQIEARLTEIEQQLGELRRTATTTRDTSSASQPEKLREVVIEY